ASFCFAGASASVRAAAFARAPISRITSAMPRPSTDFSGAVMAAAYHASQVRARVGPQLRVSSPGSSGRPSTPYFPVDTGSPACAGDDSHALGSLPAQHQVVAVDHLGAAAEAENERDIGG